MENMMAAAGGHREMVSYKECRRNHALASGGHAVDGCREFAAAAAEEEALHCQACGCHRSFHRREVVAIRAHHVMVPPPAPAIVPFAAVPVVVLQRAPVNLNLINPNNRLQPHQPQRDDRAEIDGEIDFEGQKPYLQLMKRTTIERF